MGRGEEREGVRVLEAGLGVGAVLASWVHFCLSAGNVGVGAQDLLLGSCGGVAWEGQERASGLQAWQPGQGSEQPTPALLSACSCLGWSCFGEGRGR